MTTDLQYRYERGKRVRAERQAVSGAVIIFVTILCLLKPPVYSTEIMGDGEEYSFDDSYKVYLEDDKYGDVKIIYLENIESYMVHADLKRAGTTTLTLESPNGEKTEYELHIERHKYTVTEK